MSAVLHESILPGLGIWIRRRQSVSGLQKAVGTGHFMVVHEECRFEGYKAWVIWLVSLPFQRKCHQDVRLWKTIICLGILTFKLKLNFTSPNCTSPSIVAVTPQHVRVVAWLDSLVLCATDHWRMKAEGAQKLRHSRRLLTLLCKSPCGNTNCTALHLNYNILKWAIMLVRFYTKPWPFHFCLLNQI